MHAIFETGGKQHRVAVGDKLCIDLVADKKAGDKLVFDKVLMITGDAPKVGAPLLKGAKVAAVVTDMGEDGEGQKGKKIRVFKKIRRQGYRKTQGHRQRYTEIKIEKIDG